MEGYFNSTLIPFMVLSVTPGFNPGVQRPHTTPQFSNFRLPKKQHPCESVAKKN